MARSAQQSQESKNNGCVDEKMDILAVDLFAGAGGFSKAAGNLGVKIMAAVELDPHACATYRANLIHDCSPTAMLEGDIAELDINEIEALFSKGRQCDLVLGGPPCQGFSVHRINGAGIDDPRNELLSRYFEIVAHLRPKAFLLENVPGILWPRHSAYLELFTKSAKDAGYRVEPPVVLDARDYGVPQRRKRVFILGVLKSLPEVQGWPPEPTHGDANAVARNKRLKRWATSEAAFRKAPDNDVNDVHMKHGAELVAAFKQTPKDGGSRRDSGRVLPCHERHDGHKDVYGRIDRKLPAPTMTTACVNPSKGRFVHPTLNHGITVRQAARLQTFPDDFVFAGGIMSSARQIGNAVPIVMGEAVLRPINTYLLALNNHHG